MKDQGPIEARPMGSFVGGLHELEKIFRRDDRFPGGPLERREESEVLKDIKKVEARLRRRGKSAIKNKSIPLIDLGFLYEELQDYKQAIFYYNLSLTAASKPKDRASALESLYSLYEHLGKIDEALDLFAQYVEQTSPDTVTHIYYLGTLLEKKGDEETALTIYRMAAYMGSLGAYQRILDILNRRGDRANISLVCEEMLERHPNNPVVSRTYANFVK